MCDLAITLLGKSSWYQRGEMDAESLMNVLEENDRMEKALTAENLDLHKLLEASQREREQLQDMLRCTADALVGNDRIEWTIATGCRCMCCRTYKLRGWDEKILVEEEDSRAFFAAIVALASPPAAPSSPSAGRPKDIPVQAEGEK